MQKSRLINYVKKSEEHEALILLFFANVCLKSYILLGQCYKISRFGYVT